MKRLIPLVMLLLLVGNLAGCSLQSYFSSDRTVVVQHDQNSLWNMQLGREYAAAGRYELAKEHYLMALASSTQETRPVILHELQAVDMMIQAQR